MAKGSKKSGSTKKSGKNSIHKPYVKITAHIKVDKNGNPRK
jgi:hypothetical protein